MNALKTITNSKLGTKIKIRKHDGRELEMVCCHCSLIGGNAWAYTSLSAPPLSIKRVATLLQEGFMQII